MQNPNTNEAFEMADQFFELAESLKMYIDQNGASLTDKERNDLYDGQIELLRIGGEINMVGVTLVFEDVEIFLDQIESITREVKNTVNKVLAVQDAIDLTTFLVGIGTAVLSKDPRSIFANTGKALNMIKAIESKKREFEK